MYSRRLGDRGAALVELALATPLLVLLMVGVVDFARVFYMAMELTNAARAGAQYGSKVSGGFVAATVQSVAQNASPQISPYTVPPPTETCACVTTGGTSTPQACTTPCAGGTYLAAYVTVTATKQFSTIMRFPSIPNTLTITRAVTMRAQ